MKKYLVSLILLVAISVPMLAGAATVAELQAMIAQLQAQLQAQSCVPAGGQVTGPVAPEYATHCCAGLIAQYPNDGRVGSAGVCVRPNSADPVITGISGPTSLAVGQTGTWTAKVTAPANTFIDYNINFGDGSGIASGENRKVSRVNQEISATHSYGTAGTYTITITAANNQQKGGGSPVKATMTVVVGNQPQTGGVPVVTKVRQNTLKAVRNPNNPSSPLIVLTTSAVIKATGGDVYVADLGTHLDSLSPFGGMPSYPNFNLTSTAEPTGKMLYYVRNGEEATFTKTLSYDSNQMFAGSYQGFFDRIIFSPTSDYDNVRPRSLALSNPIVAPYATNVLPVVGEQGPYIKSVTLSTAMPNVFEIRGTRLLKTSSVNIDGVSWSFFGPAAGGKQTDSTIYILNNPPLSAGSHSVYVESPTLGRSNTVTLQVGTPTPSLGVSASNALITQGAVIRDSSQNPIGQNFNINFTLVNNGSADVFVNTSGMMDIDMSGSIDGSGASTNTNTPSISPSSLSGDTSSAYIIPAGASRSFYFTASMRNDGTTLGNVNYRITGINYGPASNNTTGYKITTGLAGLSMSGAFYPGNASIKSITLTSPTSGERVLTGVDYNIRWNSATPGTNSNAKIQLSYVMNDSTYPAGRTITDDIDAVAPNMGVYQWRVPEFYQFGVDPNRFQIKVSSGSVSGTSQYFTIAHGRSTANLSVTAVAPFPARVGDQVRVGWSPYNQNDEYMLSLLKKNDDNFVRWLNLGPSNGSEKTFAVPNVPAGDYYVRVTTGNGRQNNGYSNGFTVTGATQNKTVSFTAPTGGNLTAGRSVVVSWTSTGFITPSETGRMYLYNNNGSMVANPYQNYLDKGQVVDGWNLYLAGGSFAPTLRRDLANGVYQFVMKTLGDQELGRSAHFTVGAQEVAQLQVSGPAVSATPIVNGNNPVTAYAVNFTFNLFNIGSLNAYASKDIRAFLRDSTSGGGQLTGLGTAPIAGDTATAYVIPAGGSRPFMVNGLLSRVGNSSSESLRIVAINYGTTAANPTGQSVTTGLEPLSIVQFFAGGTVPPPTPVAQVEVKPLAVNPIAPVSGQNFSVYGQVRNTGGAEAVGVQIEWFLNGKSLKTGAINVSANSAYVNRSQTSVAIKAWPGTHTIRMKVTYGGQVISDTSLVVSVPAVSVSASVQSSLDQMAGVLNALAEMIGGLR